MKVLAVMCHPDDIEYTCAGTLIKYKKQGHNVVGCHVANGNMGHTVIKPDELRKIRAKESEAASKVAGFEILCADVDDLTINSASVEQIDKIIRIIRYASPDVIFTHHPNDYCSDHVEVSKLVFNAAFSATCPQFKPELGKAAPMATIYYAAPEYGYSFTPTEYVDITDEMQQRVEMLLCHKSQSEWLLEHDGIDFTAPIYNQAKFYGDQCGVKYAEAFAPMHASGRMRPFRVLP